MLGGTARVALDLLEYDRALERAFITVCGCVSHSAAVHLFMLAALPWCAQPCCGALVHQIALGLGATPLHWGAM